MLHRHVRFFPVSKPAKKTPVSLQTEQYGILIQGLGFMQGEMGFKSPFLFCFQALVYLRRVE